MRKYMIADVSKQKMILKQLGAKVDVINSFMCYITFDIDGTEISFSYNVNKKNKYFLERIKPYPEVAGTFSTEEDVIETIKNDIEQFKNAKKCNVFPLFIGINREMSKTVREFENLYLYYNVPHHYAEEIKEKIDEIHNLIAKAKKESERVYFKTDPKEL